MWWNLVFVECCHVWRKAYTITVGVVYGDKPGKIIAAGTLQTISIQARFWGWFLVFLELSQVEDGDRAGNELVRRVLPYSVSRKVLRLDASIFWANGFDMKMRRVGCGCDEENGRENNPGFFSQEWKRKMKSTRMWLNFLIYACGKKIFSRIIRFSLWMNIWWGHRF